MEEIWKNIIEYEGYYQISNLGRVKSLERTISFGDRKRRVSEKILKTKVDKDGYLRCTLCKNGKCIGYFVHRVVMYSFEGYSNKQVNHINGIKDDNRIGNLEYCTGMKNINHQHTKLKNKKKYGIRATPKGRYTARISLNNSKETIGTYDTKEEAYNAYKNRYFELTGENPW